MQISQTLWKQAQVKIFQLEKKKTQISIEFRNKPGDGEGGYGVGVQKEALQTIREYLYVFRIIQRSYMRNAFSGCEKLIDTVECCYLGIGTVTRLANVFDVTIKRDVFIKNSILLQHTLKLLNRIRVLGLTRL